MHNSLTIHRLTEVGFIDEDHWHMEEGGVGRNERKFVSQMYNDKYCAAV